MISNKNNLLAAHLHPNLIQRNRNRIKKSLTIKPSNILFNEYHPSSEQKIKRDLNRQSPLLIRRLRPAIENHSSSHLPSSDNHADQLQLSPRTFALNSKTTKFTQIFADKKTNSNTKSHLLKYSNTHYQSRMKKINSVPDLFISPRSINHNIEVFKKANIKDVVDECKFQKTKFVFIFVLFFIHRG